MTWKVKIFHTETHVIKKVRVWNNIWTIFQPRRRVTYSKSSYLLFNSVFSILCVSHRINLHKSTKSSYSPRKQSLENPIFLCWREVRRTEGGADFPYRYLITQKRAVAMLQLAAVLKQSTDVTLCPVWGVHLISQPQTLGIIAAIHIQGFEYVQVTTKPPIKYAKISRQNVSTAYSMESGALSVWWPLTHFTVAYNVYDYKYKYCQFITQNILSPYCTKL